MRFILLILSITVTSIALAQGDTYTYGGEGYEIENSAKTVSTEIKTIQKKEIEKNEVPVQQVPKKIVKRKPAQEKLKPKPKTPPKDQSIASVTTSYYRGGIYFGGEKVPADFSYVGIDLLFPSNGWSDFGLSGGYLFNKSSVKVVSGSIYFGYKYKINDELTLRAGPQIGLSSYSEKTTIQQVNAFGLHFGAKVQVDYVFNSGLVMSTGLNWRHDMYASSFWGKDPFSDIVLDFIGPQVSLGWNF